MDLNSETNLKMFKAETSFEAVVNPNLQVSNTRRLLNEVFQCASEDLKFATNRKAKTLLETTIALVQGLIKAFDHYENCWKKREKRKILN